MLMQICGPHILHKCMGWGRSCIKAREKTLGYELEDAFNSLYPSSSVFYPQKPITWYVWWWSKICSLQQKGIESCVTMPKITFFPIELKSRYCSISIMFFHVNVCLETHLRSVKICMWCPVKYQSPKLTIT